MIAPLYKAIDRPHLEYCIQARRPYLRTYIQYICLTNVIQRRETILMSGLIDFRYEERLKECGLTTLEAQKLKGGQMEVFNILNGYGNIDSNIFVSRLRKVK